MNYVLLSNAKICSFIRFFLMFLVLCLSHPSFSSSLYVETPYDILTKFSTDNKNIVNNNSSEKDGAFSLGIKSNMSDKQVLDTTFPDLKDWDIIESKNKYQIQEWIDQIFKILLEETQFQNIICYLYGNLTNLKMYAGVSQQFVNDSFKNCNLNVPQSPPFKKRFLFVFNKNKEVYINSSNQIFDSWTDHENNTFLVITPTTTFADLTLMVLHEMIIQNDFKFQLLPNRMSQFYDVKLTNEEQDLLIFSIPINISMTFAAMRALVFEKAFIKQVLEDQGSEVISDDVDNIKKCKSQFYNILRFVTKFNNKNFAQMNRTLIEDMTIDNIVLKVSENATKKIHDRFHTNFLNPIEENSEFLEYLLNSEITTEQNKIWPNSKTNFCEFMSDPMISNKQLYTMLNFGPRPPIVGGLNKDQGNEGESEFKKLIEKKFIKN